MYLSHFGLNEPPFRITPHTEFFFSGANRGATLEALLYAITHDEGIIKVTGEVGSGKTMLCRVLVERLPKHVETIYLANPSLSRDEILHVIAADLQVESRGERVTILLRALQEKLIKLYAAGRRVVVLIDEAHAMPLETLEEVRLLSNLESNRHKLLQIVLFGQPELDDHLALPSMRQLRERITHGFRLEPLVRADIDSYVDFRMRAAGYRGPNLFAPRAMKRIARVSEGLTRRINILADKALLAAFADGAHQVTAQHAQRAIRDSEFAGRRGLPRRWLLLGAGLAAGLLAGGAIHLYYYYGQPNTPRGGTAAPAATIPTAPPPSATPLGASPDAPVAGPAATASAPATAPSASPLPASVPPVTAALASAVQQSAPPTPSLEPPTPPVAAPPSPLAPPPSPEPRPAAVVGAPDAHAGPVPPASGKLAQERFAATQQWLKTAPTGHYTIQLLTVRAADTQTLERFLRQAAERVDIEEVRVYSVKIGGEQHYSATYGLYPSLEATIDAMGDLPSTFKARGPYHRSITLMRRQNQE
jgi:type II secretory pathway predicted ATPase ExeA/septal ring-binding cell division protein DamX